MYAFHSTRQSVRVPSGKSQTLTVKGSAEKRDWGCLGMVERAEEPGLRLSFQEQHHKLHSRTRLVRKTPLSPGSTRCSFHTRNLISLQRLPLPEHMTVLCQELDLAATTSSQHQRERKRETMHTSLPFPVASSGPKTELDTGATDQPCLGHTHPYSSCKGG